MSTKCVRGELSELSTLSNGSTRRDLCMRARITRPERLVIHTFALLPFASHPTSPVAGGIEAS